MVHIGTVDRVSDCAVKTVDMYIGGSLDQRGIQNVDV